MRMQRRNYGDNCWNQRLDRSLLMESPSPLPSKLFSDDLSPSLNHPLSSTSSGGGGSDGGGFGYIKHTVTKFDTLAGVAIKYGVEVADIKRMNGLTTDIQMFSRKTLHIPLPGRHPPSPIMSNGHDMQGIEHGSKQPQTSHLPNGLHRKCRSLACELSETDGLNVETPVTNSKKPNPDTWYDKLMRRRRSEVDLQNHTPETMLKPDPTNTTTAFSPAAGKNLALRPKSASRTTSDADGPQNMPPLTLGGSVTTNAFSGVKKSTSSPSFHEPYSNSTNCTSTSSIWPATVLNLTADLQALSTAAITRPMFDGLPKPTSGRKNKAAID
ncbi:hypothetical protein E3N88_40371 [Mikania micrantha]|uniref:LysM domain-containing protein n=1 Tax=Mikania micrantha TaxID=192012 RepID=A0A5N6LMK2_9ASTR|nr:hypothetical protein E3N88_40371 [Mikania micrantha]